MASMNSNNNDRTPHARQVKHQGCDHDYSDSSDALYIPYKVRHVSNASPYSVPDDGPTKVELEMEWIGRDVDVFNDSFGNTSVKKVVKDFQRDNHGKKYIEKLELAQKLTRCDEDTWNTYSWQEQLEHGGDEQRALQSVVVSSRNSHQQKTINNDTKMGDLKNKQSTKLKKKLQKKYDDAVVGMMSDIKATKNAKRNAKRRAKAKKTKETLNFTPTKEQEEWFWGEAPHGGDE